jgi:iron complex transport system permease protein
MFLFPSRRLLFFLVIIFTSILILFILNVSLGSVSIPPVQVVKALFGLSGDRETWTNIILQFRVPKAIAAILVGSGLGISGLLMQTLFRNPLADPFILGINAGASLGVALTILAGMWLGVILTQAGITGSWILTFSATSGAFIVMILVLAVSARIRDTMSLLIIGLMIGSGTAAIVSIMQLYSKAESIQAYLIWTFGSLGGLTWNEHLVFIPVILIGISCSWLMIKPLNALLLGDAYAQSLGLNIKRTRLKIIFITSLLSGTITAFCGPIAFIGIGVPHIAKMLFKTTDHRHLLPLVATTGAAIMLCCDIIAQMPGSEFTLPINAVTSILGAPLVVWIVFRRQDISSTFN